MENSCMDKGARPSDLGLRNISHKSHSPFSSIINLSPLKNYSRLPSSPPPPHGTFSVDRQPPQNDTISLSKKQGKNREEQTKEEDRKGRTMKTSSQFKKIGSCTTSSGSGPAPKTLSILTALSELSQCESDQVQVQHDEADCSSVYEARYRGSSCRKMPSSYESVQVEEKVAAVPRRSGARRKCQIKIPHGELYSTIPASTLPFLTIPTQSARPSSSDQGGGRGDIERKQQQQEYSNVKELTSVYHHHHHHDGNGIQLNPTTPNPKAPEWIRKMFQISKRGRLNELERCLSGHDATVIRHLVDSKGRTLLHHAASGGHLGTLQWLVEVLGSLSTTALNDRDENGDTPMLSALKAERLDCFQWIILNTKAGSDALLPLDGHRSLLHYASHYGNFAAVRWLCERMKGRGISVDVKDTSSGMTPLCEAANAGELMVCHELIIAGADPLFQNAVGWKPVHFAIRQKQLECVNYLMMAEAAATVGNRLQSRLREFETLEQEYDFLCSHLRELLHIGKWLVKERTDLIKNFSSSNQTPKLQEASMLLGESAATTTRFSDIEHKLVRVEQATKHHLTTKKNAFKIKIAPSVTNEESFSLMDILAAAQSRHEPLLRSSVGYGKTDPNHRHQSSYCNATSFTSEGEDCNEETDMTYLSVGQLKAEATTFPVVTQRFSKSQSAPWLPTSFDVSLLSPCVSQLDVLGNSTCTPNHPDTSDINVVPNSSVEVTRPDHEEVGETNLPPTPTIIEVIEPPSIGVKSTPDLIWETTQRRSTSGSATKASRTTLAKSESNHRTQDESNAIAIDDILYSQIWDHVSVSPSPSKCEPVSKERSPTAEPVSSSSSHPCPSPNLIKCQNHPSSSDTDLLSNAVVSPTFTTTNATHAQSISDKNAHFPSSCHAYALYASKSDLNRKAARDVKTFNPSRISASSDFNVSSVLRSAEKNANYITSPIDIDTSSPIYPSRFEEQRGDFKSGMEEEEDVGDEGNISSTASALLAENTSLASLPVEKRKSILSFPHFPGPTTTVSDPVGGNSTSQKSQLESEQEVLIKAVCPSIRRRVSEGSLSSEASRTESVIVPPPSNGSHDSHCSSEISKTESARESMRTFMEDREVVPLGQQEVQKDHQDAPKQEIGVKVRTNRRPIENYRQFIEDDESLITSSAVVPSEDPANVATLQTKCHHHHRRRQSRAWYEIEASDDDYEAEKGGVDVGGGGYLRSSSVSPCKLASACEETERHREMEMSRNLHKTLIFESHNCDSFCLENNCSYLV